MADLPISGLPSASSLDGTELLPFVQGGVTTQVTAQDILDANLPVTSSGITVSGDIIPTTSRGASLGTVTNPFSSIFVSSGSIYVESDIPGSKPGIITNVDRDISIDSAGFRLISGSTTPFRLFREGIITVRTDYQDPTSRPLFEIIGNVEGSASLAVNPGTLLQTTAYDGQSNRSIFDSYGSSSFSQLNLRSANGSVFNPTTTGEGVIGRIGSSGWLDGIDFGIPGETALPTRIDFYGEGYTSGSRPTSIKMYTTDEGELDPNGIASLELNKDRLYVLGQLSASLQENYVWLGDSNNRNIETPVSSLSTYLTGSLVSKAYGSFFDTTTQSGSADTAYAVKHNTTDFGSGVSIVSDTRITMAEAGIYTIISTHQYSHTSGGVVNITGWLRKNGTDVSNSATDLRLKGNGEAELYAINYFVSASAGDYYELMWSPDDSSTQIIYIAPRTSPTRPAVPSVITTVNRVG